MKFSKTVVLSVLLSGMLAAIAQTTGPISSPNRPAIAPNPVSGFTPGAVSGFSQQPVSGYSFSPQRVPQTAAPAPVNQGIVSGFTPAPVTGLTTGVVNNLTPNPAPVVPQGNVVAEPSVVGGFNQAPVSGLGTNLPGAFSTNITEGAPTEAPPSPF